MDIFERELLKVLTLLRDSQVVEVYCGYEDVLKVFDGRQFEYGNMTAKYVVNWTTNTIRKEIEYKDLGCYM